jgi:serine/threonine protein kinase
MSRRRCSYKEYKTLENGHRFDAKASDIYCLGLILFEMINFGKPFGEYIPITGCFERVRRMVTRDFKYNSEIEQKISKGVKGLIYKLLEPNLQK